MHMLPFMAMTQDAEQLWLVALQVLEELYRLSTRRPSFALCPLVPFGDYTALRPLVLSHLRRWWCWMLVIDAAHASCSNPDESEAYH